MKRIIVAIAFATLAVPSVAAAATPSVVHEYLGLYHQARNSQGAGAVGCNLIEPKGSCHVQATDSMLEQSIGVLQRMLAPPPQVQQTSSDSSRRSANSSSNSTSSNSDTGSSRNTASSTGSSDSSSTTNSSEGSSGGGWAIPSSIVQCESGGENLAPNGSGASGYYQVIPGTWNGYGGYSAAYLAPKSVQDQFASHLWNGGAGAGQWVCK